MTLQPTASAPMTASAHAMTLRFVDALKRLNAKERNFLMRYALADRLSDGFVNDLVAHLQQIGLTGLDGARAVYFGMDYHLEWIHAALLLAVGRSRWTTRESRFPGSAARPDGSKMSTCWWCSRNQTTCWCWC